MVRALLLFSNRCIDISRGKHALLCRENYFIKEVIEMKELTMKDVRKVAFAVGFGLTLGKSVAELVDVALDTAVARVTKHFAKNGNELAQDICVKNHIRYEEDPKEEKSKVEMGFHCE